MEIYNGSEHGIAETYMIPETASNAHFISNPVFQEIGTMDSEVAPEFIVDHGLYYPAAANYYGYYCTGFESSGEWDDHHMVLGLDGQNLHYSGLQTESSPHVYYTPSYGYAQSPYNPYNPYIPGAVIAVDGPFIGTQHYFTSPEYQQSVSTPAYFPIVQSGSDVIPNSFPDPSLFDTAASSGSRPDSTGIKYTRPPPVSVSTAATSQRAASEPASHGSLTSGSVPHVTQGRNSPGLVQTSSDHFCLSNAPSLRSPLKVHMPSQNGFGDFGSSVHGWATAKFRPKLQLHGVLNNGNGSLDMLGEQNRGPRTSRSKGQWLSSITVKAYTSKAGATNADGNIIIYADQYNREDFLVNYPDAKFFVIKSYSEDDVHKSIKYNVWSSTPNGNKRLDSAYEDAQRISGGNPRNCPVFLFFSVNASGQFCGVAEMIGPVDFQKDMDFWQQDKWTGSFPVKWHIVKDVPNTSLRHIILENNENKPVTNSRDTQEIRFIPGMNMLNIFKNSPLKSSILDDFMYYEDRQRIMHEEKSRILGRNFDSTPCLPAFVPSSKETVIVNQPQKADERPPEPNDQRSMGKAELVHDEVTSKHKNVGASNGKRDPERNLAEDANGVSSVMKIGSLSIDSNGSDANNSRDVTSSRAPVDVVTVGSVPIKVNGLGETFSGIITFGAILSDPKHNNATVKASR